MPGCPSPSRTGRTDVAAGTGGAPSGEVVARTTRPSRLPWACVGGVPAGTTADG